MPSDFFEPSSNVALDRAQGNASPLSDLWVGEAFEVRQSDCSASPFRHNLESGSHQHLIGDPLDLGLYWAVSGFDV